MMARAPKEAAFLLIVAAWFAAAPRSDAQSSGACPVTLTISSAEDGQVASWTDSQGPTYVSLVVGREYTFAVSCSCSGHYKSICGPVYAAGTDAVVSDTRAFSFTEWGSYDLYGECWDTGGYCSASFHVVAVGEPLAYRFDEGDVPYTEPPAPLPVAKDSLVWFWALKNPSDADWPSRKPVWGGLAGGGSGTHDYKLISFSTASTSSSDHKEVSAECGNTAGVNVIVVDITAFDVHANRTSLPVEASFPVKEGEHYEVGGTFKYEIAAGWPAPVRLRREVWDLDGGDDLISSGPGRQFSITWEDGVAHGDAYVRFYIDTDQDATHETGETTKDSPEFRVERIEWYDFNVEYSDRLGNIAAQIQPRFNAAEDLVLRKDSADDWRACVRFNCASISQFTAGPDRPDPVATYEDADLHWDADSHVVFVQDLQYPHANTAGYSNRDRLDEIIIEWNPSVQKNIAHEIGHGVGIVGDYGKDEDHPDPGELGDRNIMWFVDTGASEELYKEDSDAYD